VVLDMQSVGRFAPSTVLRSDRTPNGSVPVGIPALPALRVEGTADYEGRTLARNSDWLIQNQVAWRVVPVVDGYAIHRLSSCPT